MCVCQPASALEQDGYWDGDRVGKRLNTFTQALNTFMIFLLKDFNLGRLVGTLGNGIFSPVRSFVHSFFHIASQWTVKHCCSIQCEWNFVFWGLFLTNFIQFFYCSYFLFYLISQILYDFIYNNFFVYVILFFLTFISACIGLNTFNTFDIQKNLLILSVYFFLHFCLNCSTGKYLSLVRV